MIHFVKVCHLTLFSILALLVICSCANVPESADSQSVLNNTIPNSVTVYTYKIVNTYPHDQDAWTQGLTFEDGILHEATGGYGKSSLRKIDLAGANVLQTYKLPDKYYGEGITIYKNMIIQLTWKEQTGFVYDKNDFDLLREFSYSKEGWGITYDGKRLVSSDGTSTLYFLDPETFTIAAEINVRDNDVPVDRLNELEYIRGRVYANIWGDDKIAIIDPQTGKVTGWVDLTGLLASQHYDRPKDNLNGVAYNPQNGHLFVTGKFWPILFEIELIAKQ